MTSESKEPSELDPRQILVFLINNSRRQLNKEPLSDEEVKDYENLTLEDAMVALDAIEVAIKAVTGRTE